jgi:hypothetical protein
MRKLFMILRIGAIFVGLALASNASLKESRAVTFSKDVAPILYRSCAQCHRPGDVAPFSALTYKDVRPWARSIREKVVTREMPPWHADPRYGDFTNNARLSRKEIDTLVAWVDQGADEGDPADLPSVPESVEGWRIGKPDLIFAMPQDYTVNPGDADKYVQALVQTRFKEDRWVQAAEIRPGNKRVVHHAIAHVITPEMIAKTRAGNPGGLTEGEPSIFYKTGGLSRVRPEAPVIDDGAVHQSGGSVFRWRGDEQASDVRSILLAGYAPGKEPDIYPPGAAKLVPAGSIILLQLHYSSFLGSPGKLEKDRSSIGLVFAKGPVEKRVETLTIQNHFFRIPQGASNHRVSASYLFDRDVSVISYMPHMHLRGKAMTYEAVYPDGRRETLLSVPRFNFNWQLMYTLKRPVMIPKGTKLVVTGTFDNSRGNKYNPNPTIDVRWGEFTSDEMMIGWLDYFVPNATTPELSVWRGDR